MYSMKCMLYGIGPTLHHLETFNSFNILPYEKDAHKINSIIKIKNKKMR